MFSFALLVKQMETWLTNKLLLETSSALFYRTVLLLAKYWGQTGFKFKFETLSLQINKNEQPWPWLGVIDVEAKHTSQSQAKQVSLNQSMS